MEYDEEEVMMVRGGGRRRKEGVPSCNVLKDASGGERRVCAHVRNLTRTSALGDGRCVYVYVCMRERKKENNLERERGGERSRVCVPA